MLDRILYEAARRHGDRPALIDGAGTRTYAELEAVSTAVGQALLDLGVAPGDRVGLHAFNSWEWVAAYHGILRAGATVVPINALLTADEVDFILRDCNAVALIGSDESLARVADATTEITSLSFSAFADLKPAAPLQPSLEPDAVASIAYTSGTTGHPKGAVQTHRSVYLNMALTATMHGRTDRDVLVTALPAAHVYGNVAINSTLMAGGTVALLERFEPAAALESISRHRATLFEGVPAMYSRLAADENLAAADLSTLRACTVGGQTIATSVVEEWEARTGAPLLELWGMTEVCGLGTTHPLYAPNVHGSIGVALPGISIRVATFDDDAIEAAPDEPGELQVSGPIVMHSYHGNPTATAEAFTADGWLKTGDVATLDRHRYARVVDRRKDVILSGGYNVYPAELERVVAACPGVELVAVGSASHSDLGEVPKAYVVPRPGADVDEATIISHCRAHLASYKIPAKVAFVENLPTTSTGKLLRRSLGELDV
jgi:long-chain acyl-CoA synthetase